MTFVGGQNTELTKGVGRIDRKEEARQADTLGKRSSAIHVVGLLGGFVVQGSKHTLRAESLGSTDRRHNLLCNGSTFGNIFEGEPILD